jgi:hypothetical protein
MGRDDQMHGEGNPEADRQYRNGAERFAGTKRQQQAAEEARRAIDSDEAEDLDKASEKARRKGGPSR